MATRKRKNSELAQAMDSLNDAVQHVRKAVQGRIDKVRGTAATEIARAKASLLKKTNVAQDKVEAVLKKTETRLHNSIVGAQKALDKAVREAEKRSAASAKTAAKKEAEEAAKNAPKKAPKKAAKKAKVVHAAAGKATKKAAKKATRKAARKKAAAKRAS